MKSINKQLTAGIIISLIIGGGVGYAVGMKRSVRTNGMTGMMSGGMQQGGRGGFARGQNGANIVAGEVVSFSDNMMTVKGRDGGSRIVLFTNNTKVSKSVDGARGDVIVGSNVMIIGTQNSDGTVTGDTVQLRSSSTMMMPPR